MHRASPPLRPVPPRSVVQAGVCLRHDFAARVSFGVRPLGVGVSFPAGRYNAYMTQAEGIQAKVAAGAFEFSRHAVDQSLKRRISVQEIREAIASSQMIEDYPNDKYGPSCLLLGLTQNLRPLHIQCSDPSRPLVKVITVYEPDPAQWIDLKTRQETEDENVSS